MIAYPVSCLVNERAFSFCLKHPERNGVFFYTEIRGNVVIKRFHLWYDVKKTRGTQMQYQNTRNAYHNQEKVIFDGDGEYGIPRIPAIDIKPEDGSFIRADHALRLAHPETKIAHFFTDDYIFERVWRLPERYTPIFARFKAIVAPDFSLYSDYPEAIQIFNHFRKHWLGAYYASLGIRVIPSIRWVDNDPAGHGWCLDGEPYDSTICISTHGIIKGDKRKALFLDGWQRTIERLQPKRIILYGDTFPGVEYPQGELIHIPNETMAAKRKHCRRGSE